MQPAVEAALGECVRMSGAGEIDFPEVVRRLSALEVERYHADYNRQEITLYLADGDSCVFPSHHEAMPVAADFSAAGVAAAVRQSQRGEHTYRDFVRKTMAAGCVGYFVQITGRRAIYFGRTGDNHVEHFPPAAP